jgi:hypothetical protein
VEISSDIRNKFLIELNTNKYKMDPISFFTELLIKPESEANKILLRVIKVLLILLISYLIWTKFSGVIILPKDFKPQVFFDFFITGSIIIPIIIIAFLSITLSITEGILLPLFIHSILYLLRKLISVVYQFLYSSLRNRPFKKLMKTLIVLDIVKIRKNKFAEGFTFDWLSRLTHVTDINKVGKEHIAFLSLVIQMTLIWIYIVSDGKSCPSQFYELVKNILKFLIWYIPVNLAFLCFLVSYKEFFENLSDMFRTNKT